MPRREIHQGAQGSVVCDARALPILVVRWRGVLGLELLEPFGAWLDESLAELATREQVGVLIADVRAAQRPSSEFRRAIAASRNQRRAAMTRHIILEINVLDSALMRGVIAALQWITPWGRMTSDATGAGALTRARAELAKVGVQVDELSPVELGLDTQTSRQRVG